MELDVSYGSKSLSISIGDPFHLDINATTDRIGTFLLSEGISIKAPDLSGLLSQMVKAIAGCEEGCPADAKGFVDRGFQNFELAYIEGGILQARGTLKGWENVTVRMFPDFQ